MLGVALALSLLAAQAGYGAALGETVMERFLALATGIIDSPLPWSPEREALTVRYRQLHQDPTAANSTIIPRIIVEHYTAGSSARSTIRYFSRTHLEAARAKLARGGQVNVSAHFVIERDGTIYRLLPATVMARHCIGLNHVAIGIENVGDDKTHPLTDAQLAANDRLIRFLVARYEITHLIGHHESSRLEGGPLWLERDPSYRNRKPDPGARFMARLRARVADLGLLGAP